MPRVAVFDTNVLLSGIGWRGKPFACLELARSGGLKELGARARLWLGEALAAGAKRAAARDEIEAASAGAAQIGRVRLARDAAATLARIAGDAAAAARATALDAEIRRSVTGTELEQLCAG